MLELVTLLGVGFVVGCVCGMALMFWRVRPYLQTLDETALARALATELIAKGVASDDARVVHRDQ